MTTIAQHLHTDPIPDAITDPAARRAWAMGYDYGLHGSRNGNDAITAFNTLCSQAWLKGRDAGWEKREIKS